MHAMHAEVATDSVWLPLTKAALQLGISVDTVRRRAKDGTYSSRKVPTRYGPAWQVLVEPSLFQSAGDEHAAPAAERADVAALVQLVGSLQDRLVDLARQVGYLEGRLHELHGGSRGDALRVE